LLGVFAPALLLLGCEPVGIADAFPDSGQDEPLPGDEGENDEGDPGPSCPAMQLSEIARGQGGFVLDGEARGDYAGWSVDGAGDVNGDGIADLVVGARDAEGNGTGSGRTYVVFGTIETDDVLLGNIALGIGGFAVDGETAYDSSGFVVSRAGDTNGDGLDDVIVGAHDADPNGLQNSGRAYVVFGKKDIETVSLADVANGIGGFALDGASTHDWAGHCASAAGDVNGDGLDDIIVGASRADPNDLDRSGQSYVVFGKEGSDPVLLAEVAQGIGGFAVDGASEHDSAGYSVSGAGDVNGDGLADIVLGAPTANPNGPWSGRAYVVFGKKDTDNVDLVTVALGSAGFVMDGASAYDSTGYAVSNAGDVNGDGLDDVIVGAHDADPHGESSGRSYVVFGKVDTTQVSLADLARGAGGFVLDGAVPQDDSGRSVNGAGDLNGDGLDDVIVGARGANPGGRADAGKAYVVFGKADTEAVSLAEVANGVGGFAMEGALARDWAGKSVGGAGDVNHDGVPDLVLGAPQALSSTGRAYVVFGGDFSCPDE